MSKINKENRKCSEVELFHEICSLQNILHKLLTTYFLGHRRRNIYLPKINFERNYNYINESINLSLKLLEYLESYDNIICSIYYENSSHKFFKIIYQNKKMKMKDFSKFLVSAYKDLKYVINNNNLNIFKTSLLIDNVNCSGFDDIYFNYFNQYFNYSKMHLSNYCEDIIFFGSLIDGKLAKSFSDIDNLCIIKEDVISNDRLLIDFREKFRFSLRYISGFNPMQHHKPFVITSIDLKFYPETFFPLSILSNCNALRLSSETIEYFSRNCISDNKNRFVSQISSIKDRLNNTVTNLYDFHRLISSYFLSFLLFHQLYVDSSYKSELLFNNIFKQYPYLNKHLYQKISNIRSDSFQMIESDISSFYKKINKYNHNLIPLLSRKFSFKKKYLMSLLDNNDYVMLNENISELYKIAERDNLID